MPGGKLPEKNGGPAVRNDDRAAEEKGKDDVLFFLLDDAAEHLPAETVLGIDDFQNLGGRNLLLPHVNIFLFQGNGAAFQTYDFVQQFAAFTVAELFLLHPARGPPDFAVDVALLHVELVEQGKKDGGFLFGEACLACHEVLKHLFPLFVPVVARLFLGRTDSCPFYAPVVGRCGGNGGSVHTRKEEGYGQQPQKMWGEVIRQCHKMRRIR